MLELPLSTKLGVGVELSAAIDHDLADGQHWTEEAALQYVAAAEPAVSEQRIESEPTIDEEPFPVTLGSDVSEELRSLRQLLEQQPAG